MRFCCIKVENVKYVHILICRRSELSACEDSVINERKSEEKPINPQN
jgi:hypothetical protein